MVNVSHFCITREREDEFFLTLNKLCRFGGHVENRTNNIDSKAPNTTNLIF